MGTHKGQPGCRPCQGKVADAHAGCQHDKHEAPEIRCCSQSGKITPELEEGDQVRKEPGLESRARYHQRESEEEKVSMHL